MIAGIAFDFPAAWQAGIPLAFLLLLLADRPLRRQGVTGPRRAALLSTRGLVLGLLVLLAARPVQVDQHQIPPDARSIAVLLDRSESMSVEEHGVSRHRRAAEFARQKLLPAITARQLSARFLTFADHPEPIAPDQVGTPPPNGHRTDLAAALAQAAQPGGTPPLAIIVLSDGAANETANNSRALAALIDPAIPVIAVGYGSDAGVPTLTLRQIDAPPSVAPRTTFAIAALIEQLNVEAELPLELLLFRDQQLVQRRTVRTRPGSRTWIESFRVTEDKPGAVAYHVQIIPPALPNLKSGATRASAGIRVAEEQGIRILYVQGAMTWDYKFIGLALHGDPGAKVTGLTRTSTRSVFRQNVESSGELLDGFPTTLDQLAPFRVVVLSNLRPVDLSPAQQNLLARFCGELGGGILLLGGGETFDASWQGSRLEQLLPVVFAPNRGVEGLERPFRLQLTDDALGHPAFQISDDSSTRDAWDRLPTFTRFGIVDAPKPAAQVWAVHATEQGPHGPRILLASQRYGAGLSAVCCVENFWRWRLARDADTRQFDRFWRQFLRFLAESSRQEVSLTLADQDLRPHAPVELIVERQPSPQADDTLPARYRIRVENPDRRVIADESLDLAPRRPVSVRFPAGEAGIYVATALDPQGAAVATRSLEIRDVNLELLHPARNLELLQQWTAVTAGTTIKAEECDDAESLVDGAVRSAETARRHLAVRRPLGANGWVLAALLAGLGIEWTLRRRWQLT